MTMGSQERGRTATEEREVPRERTGSPTGEAAVREPGAAAVGRREAGTAAGLKVAYVMSRFPKLTETFVLQEILALEEEGAEVEIFPLLRESQEVAHPEVERLVERARFRPFLSAGVLVDNLRLLARDPGAYLGTLRDVLAATWGSANFFLGALAVFPKAVRFAREMEELGVDHVHAHFANHPTVVAFVVRRLAGIPYSFTAHGHDLHVERRMLREKVEASAFAVTVSEYNRELMVETCGEELRDRIRVVRCGVDPEVFRPASDPGLDDEPDAVAGPFRLICVASYEEVKGHRYLVEACRLLRERGVDFALELVGDGPLRDRTEERIRDHGLDDRVEVAGPLPRPEVVRRMRAADAAVLASVRTPRGKREGIPVVLMEAMASGLPVVASDLSGIPELVEDGRTGFLVPPREPGALADALERLAGDAELRGRLGRAGREKVLREFDLRENARRLVRLLRSAADGGAGGS